MLELLRNALIGGDDGIEGVADLARHAGLRPGQAHGKIAGLHGMQRGQQLAQVEVGCAAGLLRRATGLGPSRNAAVAFGFGRDLAGGFGFGGDARLRFHC